MSDDEHSMAKHEQITLLSWKHRHDGGNICSRLIQIFVWLKHPAAPRTCVHLTPFEHVQILC